MAEKWHFFPCMYSGLETTDFRNYVRKHLGLPAILGTLIVFFLPFAVLRYVAVHEQRGYRDESIQNSWTSSSARHVGKWFPVASQRKGNGFA